MVCGVVVSKLFFRDAIPSFRTSGWLRAVDCWHFNIIVWHNASLFVCQGSKFSEPGGSLPDNDIEDKCAYGGDTVIFVNRWS